MLAAAVKLRLRYVVYTKANVNKREPKIVSRWGLSRKSVGGRGRLVIDIFVLVGRWLVALRPLERSPRKPDSRSQKTKALCFHNFYKHLLIS